MKKLIVLISFISAFSLTSNGYEKYGSTFNIGIGIGGYSGYYGYVGRSIPVIHIDYEFDVANNFTLAPFLNFYTFSNSYYYGNNNTPYANYTYTETDIPIGLKGTYYFDDLIGAGAHWDFYAAGSLGYSIVHQSWANGYTGDKNYYKAPGSLFLDFHIGTEYHISHRTGLFLDLSTGVSTIGLSFHKY